MLPVRDGTHITLLRQFVSRVFSESVRVQVAINRWALCNSGRGSAAYQALLAKNFQRHPFLPMTIWEESAGFACDKKSLAAAVIHLVNTANALNAVSPRRQGRGYVNASAVFHIAPL